MQYTKKKSLGPELDGYRLIDMQNLLNFVSVFPCPNCGGNGYTVTEDIAGLRSSLSFKCLKPDCGNTYKLNSHPDGESVNTRFEMAMFSIGRNRQQAVRLLREMNMPPPVSCTMWNRNKEKIHKASHTVAEALPKHVLKAIKPVFEKLSGDDLLQKCAHGGTQNANESVHNMIWTRCPKTVFVGRTRLEIAVYDAVSVFNEGERSRLKVFQLLGLMWNQHGRDDAIS